MVLRNSLISSHLSCHPSNPAGPCSAVPPPAAGRTHQLLSRNPSDPAGSRLFVPCWQLPESHQPSHPSTQPSTGQVLTQPQILELPELRHSPSTSQRRSNTSSHPSAATAASTGIPWDLGSWTKLEALPAHKRCTGIKGFL